MDVPTEECGQEARTRTWTGPFSPCWLFWLKDVEMGRCVVKETYFDNACSSLTYTSYEFTMDRKILAVHFLPNMVVWGNIQMASAFRNFFVSVTIGKTTVLIAG